MMTTRTATALFALAASASILAWPAQAAPPSGPVTVAEADRTPAPAAYAQSEGEDDAASCSRSRKRLWVEGEGWVVRRITTCR